MNIIDPIKTKGDVIRAIEYRDGTKETAYFRNTVLDGGKMALTYSLANQYGDGYNYYIRFMVFGDNGMDAGSERFVDSTRTSLFGNTRAQLYVSPVIDNSIVSQVIFVAVMGFEDANGYDLSEMGLQMANGQLYSMVTFPTLTKTSLMQITWSWRQSFI